VVVAATSPVPHITCSWKPHWVLTQNIPADPSFYSNHSLETLRKTRVRGTFFLEGYEFIECCVIFRDGKVTKCPMMMDVDSNRTFPTQEVSLSHCQGTRRRDKGDDAWGAPVPAQPLATGPFCSLASSELGACSRGFLRAEELSVILDRQLGEQVQWCSGRLPPGMARSSSARTHRPGWSCSFC
jgi:hypothetical protein